MAKITFEQWTMTKTFDEALQEVRTHLAQERAKNLVGSQAHREYLDALGFALDKPETLDEPRQFTVRWTVDGRPLATDENATEPSWGNWTWNTAVAPDEAMTTSQAVASAVVSIDGVYQPPESEQDRIWRITREIATGS